jgi:cohesin complex subunit SA-1/2
MKGLTGLDDLRFTATTTFLDLQTLFSTLRNAGQGIGNDEDVIFQAQSLVHEVPSDAQALIAKIHGTAERIFAKTAKYDREPAEDDAPASEDEPEDDDEENEEEDEAVIMERLRSSIVAEQRLCELTGKLVLAIIGRVVDASGTKRGSLKKRLLRNKTSLGQNYREVLSYLEERKPRSAPRNKGKQPVRSAQAGEKTATPVKNVKSAERVDDNEEEEEEQEEQEGDHDDPIEEDDEEDLRARELVEDEIVDDDNEDLNRGPDPDEDEIMGD